VFDIFKINFVKTAYVIHLTGGLGDKRIKYKKQNSLVMKMMSLFNFAYNRSSYRMLVVKLAQFQCMEQ
jgi:hypothetical protein